MAQAFGMPSLYDPSIATDELDLQRRVALAQMLRQQGLEPGGGTKMAGPIAIKNSPLEGIAKALSVGLASKMDDENTSARQKLGEKQVQAQMRMIDNLFGVEPNGGRPVGVSSEAMGQGGFPQPPEKKPDPIMEKAKAALLMGNKELANRLLANAFEKTPEMKNLEYKGVDPKALGAAELAKEQAASQRVLSPDQTVLGADNKPLFTAPSAPSPQSRTVADLASGAGLTPDQTRAAYAEMLRKQTSHQPAAITNVNTFTPASEMAQAEFMKSTRTRYDQLQSAPVALQSIEKAKALIPAARGFMGPGGEPLLEAAKFLNNRMGMSIKTEGVKSAEELRTRIFFNVMDNLKKMDAQPSQMQQQIMMDALGKLGTDPNALPAVLDAFGDSIKGKVELHNKEVQGAAQRGVKFPYDPIINLPQGGPSIDDLVKKYGG